MLTLWEELRPQLEQLTNSVPEVSESGSRKRIANVGSSVRGNQVAERHNVLVQRLKIQPEFDITQVDGGFSAIVRWRWTSWLDGELQTHEAEASGEGRSKALAKAAAMEKIMVEQGHLTAMEPDFLKRVDELGTLLSDPGTIEEAAQRTVELIQERPPQDWREFVPGVWKQLLAENREEELNQVLTGIREAAAAEGSTGIPSDVWEELLDSCTPIVRHRGALATQMMLQFDGLNLDPQGFGGELEHRYFKRFRHLLALERHGAYIQGIQLYTQDFDRQQPLPMLLRLHDAPKKGVGNMMFTTETPFRSGNSGEELRSNDVVLMVPLEDGQRFDAMTAEDKLWGDGSFLAYVGNIKRDHSGSRLSCNMLSGRGTSQSLEVGNEFQVYRITMDTPIMRMVEAMRALCLTTAPRWREPSYFPRSCMAYDDSIRSIVLDPASETSKQLANESVEGVEFDPTMAPGTLTEDQQRAVAKSMTQRVTLIQGPPGTGKTYTACAVISTWLQQMDPTEKILAVADSNVAADNIVAKLRAFGVDAVRIGDGVGDAVRDYVDGTFDDGSLARAIADGDGQATSKRHMMLARAVRSQQVTVSTCVGAGMEMLDDHRFTRVLVDECSQAVEPSALIPLSRHCERLVVIGDHRQLPATVISNHCQRLGLGRSLFEALIDARTTAPVLLTEQRRMHSSISAFPNQAFYNSALVNAVDDADRPPIAGFPWPGDGDCRVALVDVSTRHGSDGALGGGYETKHGLSRMNTTEARLLVDAILPIVQCGNVAPEEIGILTAYTAQKRELKREVAKRVQAGVPGAAQLHKVTVDTIDGFQGMEKELIMFSATRSNRDGTIGFLADARRMNVMLTRAQRGVIVFADGEVLRSRGGFTSFWGDWIDWVEKRNAWFPYTELEERQKSPEMQAALEAARQTAAAAPAAGGTWVEVQSEEHGTYYWNEATDVTQWEKPVGVPVRSMDSAVPEAAASTASSAAAEPDWVEVVSAEHGTYYWNQKTDVTQWEKPQGVPVKKHEEPAPAATAAEIHLVVTSCERGEQAAATVRSAAATLEAGSRLVVHLFVGSGEEVTLGELGTAVTVRRYEVSAEARSFEDLSTTFFDEEYRCGGQKLLLPAALPEVDRVIVVDAGALVVGPLGRLWAVFQDFGEEAALGMASDGSDTAQSWYPTKGRGMPYVGATGVHAGVLLMDLSRLRSSQVQLKPLASIAARAWGYAISRGEHDLFNIVLSKMQHLVHVLPCWANSRKDTCGQCDGGLLVVHAAGTNDFFERGARLLMPAPGVTPECSDLPCFRERLVTIAGGGC
mmetsp:Transcript_91097/g.208823  ORF Transcript_91097/g.208823 Transcript_91097/m.208823 type:complete len:1301 (+) Transcript_91097:24-3926(+)